MDLGGMMKKMQEAQGVMEQSKERLNGITVTGEADGITITMTGNKGLKDINIAQHLIDAGDKDQLEDLLTIAFNRALANAENVHESEMKNVAGSMLPGFGM